MKGTPCLTNRFSVLETCIDSSSSYTNTCSSDLETDVPAPLLPSMISTEQPDVEPPTLVLLRSARIKKSTELDLLLESIDTRQPFGAKALLDSGATGLFIDDAFVAAKNLTRDPLPRSILVYNIDGTLNEHGSVKETVDLVVRYQDHTERASFYVTTLGGSQLILGHPWLVKHNPDIDWAAGKITMSRCPEECRIRHIQVQRKHRQRYKLRKKAKVLSTAVPPLVTVEELLDDVEEEESSSPDAVEDPDLPVVGDRIYTAVLAPQPDPTCISATSTVSQRLAEAAEKDRVQKSWKDIVPESYHQFEKVFLKESFDELPQQRKWDHAIELIPGAEPFSTKIYPMSPKEQEELDRFLDENLKSGRIRPSKSPMASPVFFVKKKDGSLRFVQDYRKLNALTIKNAYPLPLISDLVTKVSKAKFFTKLDVRWGYNNIRIKDGDEWKAAFRTNRGLFEPRVMFFGLTNSPATFQTMMNEIFKGLIDEGVVVVYMDDILIFTATLEEHRRVVRRVLEILAENNLFLKPEKCVFEALEVDFVGLVILEGQWP